MALKSDFNQRHWVSEQGLELEKNDFEIKEGRPLQTLAYGYLVGTCEYILSNIGPTVTPSSEPMGPRMTKHWTNIWEDSGRACCKDRNNITALDLHRCRAITQAEGRIL